jgi:hypothetical protein
LTLGRFGEGFVTLAPTAVKKCAFLLGYRTATPGGFSLPLLSQREPLHHRAFRGVDRIVLSPEMPSSRLHLALALIAGTRTSGTRNV